MDRVTMHLAMAFITAVLGCSGNARAFTLRLAPVAVPGTLSDAPETAMTDLPAPQFFRFVIGPSGITLALDPAFARDVSLESVSGLEEIRAPQPATAPTTPQARTAPLPRRLSGIEALLLRQTEIVGDRQSE